MKKRSTQLIALLLVVVMMTACTIAYGATTNQMADEIIGYFDTFTAKEITQIQTVSGKIDTLTDEDWDTILNDSTYKLLTDEAIAKFASEEEASAKLKSLVTDIAKIEYSVTSKTELETALANFKTNQGATLQTLFGPQATTDNLLNIFKDAKAQLSSIDIGDSSTNSDLYKIVYGDEANYIDGVESLLNKAVVAALNLSKYADLKAAFTAVGYNENYLANISRLVNDRIEGSDVAKALIYNSVMSKNIKVTESGSAIQNGSTVDLGTAGNSKRFVVTIFGQNVSVPFGANIPLNNSYVKISTGGTGNNAYFEINTTSGTSQQIQIKRGKGDSASIVEESNVFFYFNIRSTNSGTSTNPNPPYNPSPGVIVTPKPSPSATTGPTGEPTGKPSFTDTENHWAKEAVSTLVDAGVVDGYDDGTFKPDLGVSRAELSKMIAKIFDLDTSDNSAIFEDCANHWANAAINACAKAGFVTGFDENTFGPDVIISREQLVTIVGRTFNWSGDVDAALAQYPDFANVSDYAKPYMAAAIEMGIIKGYDDGTIKGENNITRAEACTILTRAYNDKLLEMIDANK